MHTLLDELELMGISKLRFPDEGSERNRAGRGLDRIEAAAWQAWAAIRRTAKRTKQWMASQIEASAEIHRRMDELRSNDSRYALPFGVLR